MRGGYEGGFELGGWEPDSGFHHRVVEAAEGGAVRPGGGVEVGDRLAGEEPGKHGADVVGGHGNAGLVGDGGDAVCDGERGLFELAVYGALMLDEVAEGGDAGAHG